MRRAPCMPSLRRQSRMCRSLQGTVTSAAYSLGSDREAPDNLHRCLRRVLTALVLLRFPQKVDVAEMLGNQPTGGPTMMFATIDYPGGSTPSFLDSGPCIVHTREPRAISLSPAGLNSLLAYSVF
eukprot:4655856-Pleurochrysis_carterae.AAC.4